MTRTAKALAALVVAAAIGAGAWTALRGAARETAADAGDVMAEAPVDSAAMAPAGTRVRVEVLNATAVRGLARRATAYLRDLGYDVVANGNAAERRASSAVLVRRDDGEVHAWAARAARAMGGAAVVDRPDSLRYVDLTVLVGADWRPPPGPLRP